MAQASDYCPGRPNASDVPAYDEVVKANKPCPQSFTYRGVSKDDLGRPLGLCFKEVWNPAGYGLTWKKCRGMCAIEGAGLPVLKHDQEWDFLSKVSSREQYWAGGIDLFAR